MGNHSNSGAEHDLWAKVAFRRNRHLAFQALGDHAVVVQLGERIDREVFDRVQALSQYLEQATIPGIVEHVPAYTTVTIYYDPLRTTYAETCIALERLLAKAATSGVAAARTIEIPVCYGGEFGVDLEYVAERSGATTGEVIAIHCSATYRVHMLGFTPGFPYLGGMPERIAIPRRSAPRLKVPAGSVGIAGSQTGIYPLETPGGWQIIGRTPLALFRPDEDPPTLLSPGNLVRFRRITSDEFAALREERA
jgi:inhibitor of KinA